MSTSLSKQHTVPFHYTYNHAALSASPSSRYQETPSSLLSTDYVVKRRSDDDSHLKNNLLLGLSNGTSLTPDVTNSHRHGLTGVSRVPLAPVPSLPCNNIPLTFYNNDKSLSNSTNMIRHPLVPMVPSNDTSIQTLESTSLLF